MDNVNRECEPESDCKINIFDNNEYFEVGSPESIRELEYIVEEVQKIVDFSNLILKGIEDGKIEITI